LRKGFLAGVGLVLVAALPAAGQAVGGMLYSYAPHTGQRSKFDEGYRRHLAWHVERRDSLPWYGWDIIAGRRMDQFIDGTFGVRFAALDNRVDPAGDAADAAASFAPHARATARWAVRLRPELSTHTPLETRQEPPRLVQVVTYRVAPGVRNAFEAVLAEVRAAAAGRDLLQWTVYETVAGAADVEFMVMVWRAGMASFDEADRDPLRLLGDRLSNLPAGAVRSESELWQFRSDLTHVPDRER